MPDLSSPDVAVTLHDDGTWSIEWPTTGLRVGPLRATVAANGATEPVAGPWQVEGDTARAGGVDGAPAVDLAFADAVNAAVNAFNKELLASHIRSCVVNDIRDGKDEVIDELVCTLQKLMK